MSEYQKGRERGYELGKLAASDTVQALSDTIEALRAENNRLQFRIDDLVAINAKLAGRTATINSLRAENAKLREALNGLVDVAQYCDGINTSEQLRAARAAMGESDND